MPKVLSVRTDLYPPIEGVKVIGIGYKARQGKDTACAAIKRIYPLAERFAFADDLKAYARIAHGMREKDAPLLQKIGADKRRENSEIWLESVYWKITDMQPSIAIITDMRHANELAMVKAMGGLTINLERYERGERFIDPSRDPNHPSEAELDGFIDAFDVTIRNDGSLAQFQDAVTAAVRKYIG